MLKVFTLIKNRSFQHFQFCIRHFRQQYFYNVINIELSRFLKSQTTLFYTPLETLFVYNILPQILFQKYKCFSHRVHIYTYVYIQCTCILYSYINLYIHNLLIRNENNSKLVITICNLWSNRQKHLSAIVINGVSKRFF